MYRLVMSVFIACSVSMLAACSKENSAPDPKLVEGEAIYKSTCKVCHAQSINGAPIPGNKKMWEPRAAQGMETLVQHASQGFGLMPARGGNAALTDAQLESAITYMLSLMKDKPQ